MTTDNTDDHDSDDLTEHEHDNDSANDPSMEQVNADLRHGDTRDAQHDAGEGAAPAGDTGTRTSGSQQAGAQDVEYDARAEAKRLIKASDAQDSAAAIQDAIETVTDHREDLAQKLQHAQQEESQTEHRLRELREAKAHLRRAPDSVNVTRTFGGGLTKEVPPAHAYDDPDDDERAAHPDDVSEAEADLVDWHGVYDREDYLRDMNETIDSLTDDLAAVRERQQKFESGLENASAILRELQDAREWTSTAGPRDDGGRGGAGRQSAGAAREGGRGQRGGAGGRGDQWQ